MEAQAIYAVIHEQAYGRHVVGLYATEAAADALALVSQQEHELDRAEVDAYERSMGREPWEPRYRDTWRVQRLGWGECRIGHAE